MKKLSESQVAEYKRDGYIRAVDVLTTREAAECRKGLEEYEKQTGKKFGFPEKTKTHLLFDWADSIVHNKNVLDAVEDLIGPDILLYHATMHGKEAGVPAFVLWHQDDAYFQLAPAEHVTVWVALSDASELAGCMRMIPGSHELGLIPHTDNPSEGNIIRRGMGIIGRFADDDGQLVPLKAGQASFHHTHTVHASGPNRSNDRRIGFGLSFIPTHVKPQTEPRSAALLVRGEDKYNYYHVEKRLDRSASWADRQTAHKAAYDVYMAATRIPEGSY